MGKYVTVEPGDCISSIAFENGFFPPTVWDAPENEALRELRKDPNVLYEGDRVFVPDLRQRSVTIAAGATHRFHRHGVPEIVRLRFLDADGKPRAGVPYVFEVDGATRNGSTDGDGCLREYVPPNAQRARLKLGGDRPRVFNLELGHLDPVAEISGVQARLASLGYQVEVSRELDDQTRAALTAFQQAEKLSVSGAPDDPTRDRLEARYRSKQGG